MKMYAVTKFNEIYALFTTKLGASEYLKNNDFLDNHISELEVLLPEECNPSTMSIDSGFSKEDISEVCNML